MKKYLSLLKYEFKTMVKDPTNLFMLFYPFLVLFLLGYVVPAIMEKAENDTSVGLVVILTAALVVGGYIFGALLGFSLIENKDERTILSICVTPIKVEGYTTFKIVYSYVISIIGNIIIVGGLKLIAADAFVVNYGNISVSLLDNLGWLKIIIFALVNSLFVPTVALVIASIAKNKVEAFAIMKSGGIVIMIPILALLNFFQDGKQYLLGIAPNFWAVKAMLNEALQINNASNLNYYLYMLIGAIYLVFLSVVTLRMFIKKLNMN